MPSMRKIWLGLALVASIVVSLIDPPAPETVEPGRTGPATARRSAPEPARGEAPLLPTAYSPRAPFGPPLANLFAAHSWQRAPALPPKVQPPAPAAPPLPFRYLGKLLEHGDVIAFLSQDTRTYLLRQGDVVADYKVIEITSAEMTFVYLPLNEKQRLSFGSAN